MGQPGKRVSNGLSDKFGIMAQPPPIWRLSPLKQDLVIEASSLRGRAINPLLYQTKCAGWWRLRHNAGQVCILPWRLCQHAQRAPRVPDGLIHLCHPVVELAVVELPAVDRRQRRRRQRRPGDIVLDRQDQRPAPPTSRLGPVRRSDGLAERRHALEPEQPPFRPPRDLDGDAGGDQCRVAVKAENFAVSANRCRLE